MKSDWVSLLVYVFYNPRRATVLPNRAERNIEQISRARMRGGYSKDWLNCCSTRSYSGQMDFHRGRREDIVQALKQYDADCFRDPKLRRDIHVLCMLKAMLKDGYLRKVLSCVPEKYAMGVKVEDGESALSSICINVGWLCVKLIYY